MEDDRTRVEYTIYGFTWQTIDYPYLFNVTSTPGDINSYRVQARQVDRAGNEGTPSDPEIFTLGEQCSLLSVICDTPDGAYKEYGVLEFKLIFSHRVYTTGVNTITIGDDFIVNIEEVAEAERDFTLTGRFTVPANIEMNPVRVSAINIDNVRSELDNSTKPIGDTTVIAGQFNRPDLKVISTPLTIASTSPATGDFATAGVLTPVEGRSVMTLAFNRNVWSENGLITVKPAGNWYIPPVLTNAEFARITSHANVTSVDTNILETNYIRTTHGLLRDTNGQVTGAPDTSTKYVLRFDIGIHETTGTVNRIRNILNSAEYMWQSFDVNDARVTGASRSPLMKDCLVGTDVIEIHFDQLADGRFWSVEITEGAFRDQAGNSSQNWTNNIWSDKVADPVIRVERVSNNRALPNTAGTLQTRVRFRIDCETPGAVIHYGTWNKGTEAITTNMTDSTIYGGRETDGAQNSNILDATVAELLNETNVPATTPYTPGDFIPVGGGVSVNYADTSTINNLQNNTLFNRNDLYTARKDYIAARATSNSVTGYTDLEPSNRSYEGVFKTLIILRNMDNCRTWAGSSDHINMNTNNDRYFKIEGTDQMGAAVNNAAFPLSNNDMTGQTSKFLLRHEIGITNVTDNVDWIWITWEVVVPFWHSAFTITSNDPNSTLDTAQWILYFDHSIHTYRKYGNWGLRVRNRP